MVARGFFVLYVAASASWLVALFASPVLGALLSAAAAWGFWRVAQGIESWSRQRRHASYELAVLASRGAAVAVVLASLSAASWLVSAQQPTPLETWGARVLLYATWTGLWILYYYVIQVRLEDLGISNPPSRHPLTFTALGLSILISPVLTEALAAPPDAKLALAVAMYAGFMSPVNVSAVLAAFLVRK